MRNMGRKENDRNPSPDDQISLNSVGFPHGQVDFFAPQKKTQAFLHRKLKVVQTWVFIQALIILLLTAYLVLLSVWLNPFFPMNYSGCQCPSIEGSRAAMAAEMTNLKTEVSNATKRSGNVTEEVEKLQAWRVEQVNKTKQMRGTLKRHTSDIQELRNETILLNSSISTLSRLSRRAFNKADSSLTTSNGLLSKMKQYEAAFDSYRKSATGQMESLQDQISTASRKNDEQIEKLKAELNNEISTLTRTTQTDTANLSKRISDASSIVDTLLTRVEHFGSKTAVDILKTNHNNMNASLDSIREEQRREKEKLEALSQKLDTLQTETSNQIQSTSNNIKVGLGAVQEKQREIMNDLKAKLAQERELSLGEVAQLRSRADAEIGKLGCRVDNMTQTITTTREDLAAQIDDTSRSLTQIIMNGDTNVEILVKSTIESAEDQLRTLLKSTEKTLTTRIDSVTSILDKYKTTTDGSIQELYNRSEEMKENMNTTYVTVTYINKTLEEKVSGAFEDIMNLWKELWVSNESISVLQTTSFALNRSISFGKQWCSNRTEDLQIQIDELTPRFNSSEYNLTCLRQRVSKLETEGRSLNRSVTENDINVRLLINKNKIYHSERFDSLKNDLGQLEMEVDKNQRKLGNVTANLISLKEDLTTNSYDLTNPLSLKSLIYGLEKTQEKCHCFDPDGPDPTMQELTEEEEEEERKRK